jgi:hypothetical protein
MRVFIQPLNARDSIDNLTARISAHSDKPANNGDVSGWGPSRLSDVVP